MQNILVEKNQKFWCKKMQNILVEKNQKFWCKKCKIFWWKKIGVTKIGVKKCCKNFFFI